MIKIFKKLLLSLFLLNEVNYLTSEVLKNLRIKKTKK